MSKEVEWNWGKATNDKEPQEVTIPRDNAS